MSDRKFQDGDKVILLNSNLSKSEKIGTVNGFYVCDCGKNVYKVVWDIMPNYHYWPHEDYLGLLESKDKMKETKSIYPEKDVDYFRKLQNMNPTLYNLFECCVMKIVTKNHDYAGTEDFYRNFRKSESVDIPAWKGIFVRFQDKVSRIEGFIKTGILKVTDESIRDTVIDAANYILLMYACYIDSGNTKAKVVDQRDAP